MISHPGNVQAQHPLGTAALTLSRKNPAFIPKLIIEKDSSAVDKVRDNHPSGITIRNRFLIVIHYPYRVAVFTEMITLVFRTLETELQAFHTAVYTEYWNSKPHH